MKYKLAIAAGVLLFAAGCYCAFQPINTPIYWFSYLLTNFGAFLGMFGLARIINRPQP